MSIADIEKVRAAETKAEEIRKKAEDDMAQIIAAGKKEAKDLIDKTTKEAEKSYKEVIDKAEAEAAKLYEETIEAQKDACEKIKTDGRAKIGAVIDDIVGKVVDIDGNS